MRVRLKPTVLRAEQTADDTWTLTADNGLTLAVTRAQFARWFDTVADDEKPDTAIRPGDHMAFTVDALQFIYGLPGHATETMVVREIKTEPDGTKTAIVGPV